MNTLNIRNSLLAYWVENYKTTPTLYENTKLPDTLKAQPFVTFEIEFSAPTTIIGSSVAKTRHRGFVAITVNVPIGSGNKTAYTLAQEAIELLEHKRIDSYITFNSGYVDRDRYSEEHYTNVIIIPFTATVG